MYLDAIAQHNPDLIRVAARLHQEGQVPAGTYVIDLETVRSNAVAEAREAKRVGIKLYFMTKHFNRNPVVAHAIVAAGIPSAVAVELQDALYLHRYGVPIGHVGHLVQIPRHALKTVLKMHPEVMTVFSVEKARQVSEAARELGLVQGILLRVRAKEDIIYPNEEGGIWEEDLEAAAREIRGLRGVRVDGAVTFPATLFNSHTGNLEETTNFQTLRRAGERLAQMGFEVRQLNAPGASSAIGFETVAAGGGTHAEPGHALTGTTPAVLYNGKSPERPALVYVNEVSHLFEGKAYVFGGGFYACDTPANRGDDSAFHTDPWIPRAFVGRAGGDIFATKVPVDKGSFFGRTLNATDYYGGTLLPEGDVDIKVGDTVVYGFRPQIFTTRATVAVVDNVSTEPVLLGVFDRANNLLDENLLPIEGSIERVRHLLHTVV